MKRLTPVLLLGILLGYFASLITSPLSLSAQRQTPSAPTQTPYRNGPPPPEIPPVPGLPLYPDAPVPNKAMHWSIDDLRAFHAARVANIRAGGAAFNPAAPGPRFESQDFRTHRIGLAYRQKFTTPRPSNTIGLMSLYDDADQHEGAADFYVMVGGSGKFIVDGEITNREIGRMTGSTRNHGDDKPLMTGEFHGQPVINGHAYEGKEGDWLAIPPGIPHWWNPTPNEGMTYLLFKLYINVYPRSLID
jgi:hypothetical protein